MKPVEPKPTPTKTPGNPPQPPPPETWWESFEDLKNEREVSKLMKKDDPGKMDFSEEFFDQMHAKIMAKVEDTSVRPVSPLSKMLNKKFLLKSGFSLMALLVVLAIPEQRLSPAQGLANADQFSQEFLEAAKSNPEQFSEMLVNYQSQSDFFGDVALESFHHDKSHESSFIQSFVDSFKL